MSKDNSRKQSPSLHVLQHEFWEYNPASNKEWCQHLCYQWAQQLNQLSLKRSQTPSFLPLCAQLLMAKIRHFFMSNSQSPYQFSRKSILEIVFYCSENIIMLIGTHTHTNRKETQYIHWNTKSCPAGSWVSPLRRTWSQLPWEHWVTLCDLCLLTPGHNSINLHRIPLLCIIWAYSDFCKPFFDRFVALLFAAPQGKKIPWKWSSKVLQNA